MKKGIIFGVVAIAVVGGFVAWRLTRTVDLPRSIPLPEKQLPFTVPDGYRMEVFDKGLTNPRVIAFDPQGRVLVSETDAGRVTLVGESTTPILENLDKPHGLAFYTDPKTKQVYLYVATVREVARYPYDVARATVDVAKKKNIVNLPAGGRHVTRTIGFGKDFRDAPLIAGAPRGSFLSPIKLYVSVGSSCDVCLENTWKYAAILESDPTGTYTAEVAGGLRNSVFFDFHPSTGELWATEMGRDGLGDNLPPDEINIVKPPLKYGWPYCYGSQVPDRSFTEKTDRTDLPMDCSKTEPPVIELPAHVAPLGIAFMSPTELLVAYHGSWNRSEPVGYKIVKITLDAENHVIATEDFITGWLADGDHIYGRPVDLKFDAQKNLYITDDSAGIIYKVSPPRLVR